MDEFWDAASKFSNQLYAVAVAIAATITVMMKPWQYRTAVRERRANEIEAAKIAEREAVRRENERLVAAIRAELKPIENHLCGLSRKVGKIDTTQDEIDKKVDGHAERISKLEGRVGD
ncbi:MAG: hypothetical protein WAS05_00275 [Candidatus Nanopelagicales bacterium]